VTTPKDTEECGPSGPSAMSGASVTWLCEQDLILVSYTLETSVSWRT
jgi:hypothetical protein